MSKAEEARLLFTLLSAAEEEDRLRPSMLAEKWRDLRGHLDAAHVEKAHAALIALFDELERTDMLAGTWIQFRWSAAKVKRDAERRRRKKARGRA